MERLNEVKNLKLEKRRVKLKEVEGLSYRSTLLDYWLLKPVPRLAHR
jgi:hypothetical protein